MARLQATVGDLFGPDARLQPVGYESRPFSDVLRLGICRAAEPDPFSYCFLKVVRPKAGPDGAERMRRRVRHEFTTTQLVHESLAGHADLGVVRPLACYEDELAIVTEEARGRTLLAHLEREARWRPGRATMAALAEVMRRCGRWLQAFQAIQPGHDRTSPEELRAYMQERLDRHVALGSRLITPAVRSKLLSHIDELAAAVPAAAWRNVIIHADLAPGNVLVEPGRLVVLDFAMASRGTALHDLSRLAVQLSLLAAKPVYSARVVRELTDALLDGYRSGLTDADPLFRLLSLLHRLNHLTTLAVKPPRFPGSLLAWRQQAAHASWLRRELMLTGRRV